MKLRRSFCIFLALTLAFVIAAPAVTALARGIINLAHVVPIATAKEIWITGVTFPAAGRTPSFECEIDEENSFGSSLVFADPEKKVTWYLVGNGSEPDVELPSTWSSEADKPVFEEGKTYRFHTDIRGSYGTIYIGEDTSKVYLKSTEGETAIPTLESYSIDYGYMNIFGLHIDCVFGPVTSEKAIKYCNVFNVEEPIAGNYPKFDWTVGPADKCNTTGVQNPAMEWLESTDGGNTFKVMPKPWEPGYRQFAPNNVYKVETYVTATGSYYFSSKCRATLNGEVAECYVKDSGPDANKYATVSYTFDRLPTASESKITYVHLKNVAFPVIGNTPRYDFDLASETKNCELSMPGAGAIWYRLAIGSESDWKMPTNWEDDADAPLFEESRIYRFKTEVSPKPGYTFPDADGIIVDITSDKGVTVNGRAYNTDYGALLIEVDLEVAPLSSTAVKCDIINVKEPVDGEDQLYTFTIASGSHCEKSRPGAGATWYESTDGGKTFVKMDTNGEGVKPFKAGNIYKFETDVTAEDDFLMSESLKATVNGNTAECVVMRVQGTSYYYATISYTFPPAKEQPTEAPATEEPTEEPATDAPVTGEPATDEPSTGEPAGNATDVPTETDPAESTTKPDDGKPDNGKQTGENQISSLLKALMIVFAVVIGLLLCAALVLVGVLIGKKQK
ncbi:MAG: hypothetical protein J6T65_02180 [Clostridia bacterium]|nr:hypothetical protein [Clostridia bacterium]